MQFHHIGYRVKGLYWLGNYALRWGIASEEACRRLKILAFWEMHGLAATRDAFGGVGAHSTAGVDSIEKGAASPRRWCREPCAASSPPASVAGSGDGRDQAAAPGASEPGPGQSASVAGALLYGTRTRLSE
jgi:hypothetical protein